MKAKNFSAKTIVDGKTYMTYINNDTAKYVNNGKIEFNRQEKDDKGFDKFYVLQQNGDKWHKNFAEYESLDALIFEHVGNVNDWKLNSDKSYSATIAGQDLKLKINDKVIRLETISNGATTQTVYLFDANATSAIADYPHEKDIVDETKPPVEEKNIYKVVDGKYVFDIPVLVSAMQPWLNGDNQRGKNFLAGAMMDDNYRIGEVLF